jgi:hypothetical protein
LPSIKGTTLDFLREILADKKSYLKLNEVIHLEVPFYKEISVKNLYEDALSDPVLSKYMPTKKQVLNRLPERNFFFGIMCTIKR